MTYDYVVVGAGVAGMTAAVVLAKAGRRVALVEEGPVTGPVIRGFTRGGVAFDTGFHYAGALGEGAILDRLLRYLGLAGDLEPVPLDPEGFDRVRGTTPRFAFAFPWGGDRVRERLVEAFPAERAAIDAYLDAVREVCRRLPYLNLDADLDEAPLLGGQGPSLAEYLDGLTGDRQLKNLLSVHCLLHGVSPAEVPFAHHAYVAGPYYATAHGLRGGGRSLARAFDRELARLGVDVRCGRAVTGIRVSSTRRVEGVDLEGGERLETRGCVCTVHPRRLLDLVPEHDFRPAFRKRLAGLGETASAFKLYGTCDRLPDLLTGSNLFLARALDRPLSLEGRPLEERLLYLAPTTYGAADGAAGVVVICIASAQETARWAASTTGRRPPEYRAFKEEVARRIRRRLEEDCPEVVEGVTWVEAATPLTLRDYAHSPAGSLYGAKHAVGQYNPQPVTRVGGLLLAGQGVVAPGVLGAALSALLVCGGILGHEHLREELRRCA